MEKKQGVEDDFLAGLEDNKDTIGLETEELFPEDKEAEQIEEETKEVPFHKNEKLQRYIDKEIAKRTKDFKPSATETFRQEVSDSKDDDLIQAFTAVVGNDTVEKQNLVKKFVESLDKRDARATQKALAQIEEVQQQAEQEEAEEFTEALDELEEGREEIEASQGKPLTDRQWNAYKDFLLDIEPRGGYQEYPDFTTTFEYFKKSVSNRSNKTAKDLASKGMERSTTSGQTTPSGSSWKDWEKAKEQLLNSN